MLPPYLQCQSGHLVCGNCRPKVSACPTCRGPVPSIRNLGMEKIASKYDFKHFKQLKMENWIACNSHANLPTLDADSISSIMRKWSMRKFVNFGENRVPTFHKSTKPILGHTNALVLVLHASGKAAWLMWWHIWWNCTNQSPLYKVLFGLIFWLRVIEICRRGHCLLSHGYQSARSCGLGKFGENIYFIHKLVLKVMMQSCYNAYFMLVLEKQDKQE
jgi:hypothetical protein